MVVRSFSAKEEKNYILLEINPPQEHVLTLRENTNLEEDGTSVKHDCFIQAASQPPPHIHNHNVVLAQYLPTNFSIFKVVHFCKKEYRYLWMVQFQFQ